jgi:alkaline phosphatase D
VFLLGIASGEPAPDGAVLWTRLAPDPLHGGGMGPEDVPVRWELAADDRFGRIVRSGTAIASHRLAHSVHLELAGLEPARPYWYRFHALGETSPVGRTRTAPRPQDRPAQLRFAVASCQHYEHGYYTAYRHMAREDLDLVLHLGDYIYENGVSNHPLAVRRHLGRETRTLAEYRNRYALYKSDPDLQAAHAAFPWLAVWDDHEVENDYAGAVSEERSEPTAFLKRRAAAYQAYFEHMPLSPRMAPRGADATIYRRRSFGNLVDLLLLDCRQYRSPQACRGPQRWGGQVIGLDCPELRDRQRVILGPVQERWLSAQLAASRANWTVLGQQMLMASLIQPTASGEPGVWSDGWDGYPEARRRLLAQMEQHSDRNFVALGGDIHSFWSTELRTDFTSSRARAVGSEFVATSISSRGIPSSITDAAKRMPHIRFAEGRYRGYLRCTVLPSAWIADFAAVDSVRSRDASLRTLARFAVERGRPGPQVA